MRQVVGAQGFEHPPYDVMVDVFISFAWMNCDFYTMVNAHEDPSVVPMAFYFTGAMVKVFHLSFYLVAIFGLAHMSGY